MGDVGVADTFGGNFGGLGGIVVRTICLMSAACAMIMGTADERLWLAVVWQAL